MVVVLAGATMKEEFVLPREVTLGATVRGNEYGWRPDAFPSALDKACGLGNACLGGEFQFRVPRGVYEMYALSVEVNERGPEESWEDFQTRSCQEALHGFERRLAETDFVQEGRRWRKVHRLSGRNAKPLEYLRFVADFVSRERYEALQKATNTESDGWALVTNLEPRDGILLPNLGEPSNDAELD
jgi:hypothetical protein